MAIHHSVIKKATRLGFTFVEAEPSGFRLLLDGTTHLSIDVFDSTAEAFEAFEEGSVEFETDEDEEESSGSSKCGVMAKNYHDEYSSNPHGPGCGDSVDIEMRNAIMVLFEGDKTPRVDRAELRKIGEDCGLWKPSWEGLNVGMQRMNLANRIRGLLRNNPEVKVTIGSKTSRFGVAARTLKTKPVKLAKAA